MQASGTAGKMSNAYSCLLNVADDMIFLLFRNATLKGRAVCKSLRHRLRFSGSERTPIYLRVRCTHLEHRLFLQFAEDMVFLRDFHHLTLLVSYDNDEEMVPVVGIL